jgi:bifunctional non-homologous end joining protein LigD
VHISLKGKKLKGEWTLTRDHAKGEKAWVLEKVGSAGKPITAKKDDESALSGRTMSQIRAARDATWHSNRTSVPGLDLDKLPRSEMQFAEPMLAQPVAELPEGPKWQYEIKLDGYRALAVIQKGAGRLLSRRNNVLNDKFPSITEELKNLEDGLILDGEIVALDTHGRPSFNLLQHRRENANAIVYHVFDVLAFRERDVRQRPLRQRRELLDEVFQSSRADSRISSSRCCAGGSNFSRQVAGSGSIIAKRVNSRYESKQRSGAWVKYRVNKGQELVIGGYRAGKNDFDNLPVGYYDDASRLIFIAKIKNGFTPDLKKQVFDRLRRLETKVCPFDNLPEPKTARRGEALTAEAMKKYRWVKPKLVAQVEFTDWTAADHLRHSRFVGLRDDKDPKDVHKES